MITLKKESRKSHDQEQLKKGTQTAENMMNEAAKGLLIMATGTGNYKTLPTI